MCDSAVVTLQGRLQPSTCFPLQKFFNNCKFIRIFFGRVEDPVEGQTELDVAALKICLLWGGFQKALLVELAKQHALTGLQGLIQAWSCNGFWSCIRAFQMLQSFSDLADLALKIVVWRIHVVPQLKLKREVASRQSRFLYASFPLVLGDLCIKITIPAFSQVTC